MNDSSLNLRTLFSFPDPAATTPPSNQWQEFQSRLGREIKTIKWPAAMPDLASKIGELFNVELPDLLVSSWKKARELQEALEESRKSPEEVIVLDLAEHEITNEYHPYIEIRIAGMPLPKKIEFKVQIVTALKGINLKIQAGTITEIQAGSCDFEGKIKYQDLTIAEKKVGPIELLSVVYHRKAGSEPHEVMQDRTMRALKSVLQPRPCGASSSTFDGVQRRGYSGCIHLVTSNELPVEMIFQSVNFLTP